MIAVGTIEGDNVKITNQLSFSDFIRNKEALLQAGKKDTPVKEGTKAQPAGLNIGGY